MKNGKETQSFEELMKRIDEISKQLGSDDVSLEESLALYEEGVALVRVCNDRLLEAERKIKMLKISDSGEIEETEILPQGEN